MGDAITMQLPPIRDDFQRLAADQAHRAGLAAVDPQELKRLRQIELAVRLVWRTHLSFPGLEFVPGTPLDMLREALEAEQ